MKTTGGFIAQDWCGINNNYARYTHVPSGDTLICQSWMRQSDWNKAQYEWFDKFGGDLVVHRCTVGPYRETGDTVGTVADIISRLLGEDERLLQSHYEQAIQRETELRARLAAETARADVAEEKLSNCISTVQWSKEVVEQTRVERDALAAQVTGLRGALQEAGGVIKLLYRDKPRDIIATCNDVLDRNEKLLTSSAAESAPVEQKPDDSEFGPITEAEMGKPVTVGWVPAAPAELAELRAWKEYATGLGLVIGLNKTSDCPEGRLAHDFREDSELGRIFREWSDAFVSTAELVALREDRARWMWAIDHPEEFGVIINGLSGSYGPDAAANQAKVNAAIDVRRNATA